MLVVLAWLSAVSRAHPTTAVGPDVSPWTVLVVGQQGLTDLTTFTGTLVGSRWVLTARSCLYHNMTRLRKFLVYAGGSSYQEYTSRRLPSTAQLLSSYQTFLHTKRDLALLKTQGDFQFNDYVKFLPINNNIPLKFHLYTCQVSSFAYLPWNSTGPYRVYDDAVRTGSPCPRGECDHAYYAWQKMQLEYWCTSWDTRLGQDDVTYSTVPGAGLVCDGELHAVGHLLYKPVPGNNCRMDPVPVSEYTNVSAAAVVFTGVHSQYRWFDEIMFPERYSYPFPGCSGFGRAADLCASPWVLLLSTFIFLTSVIKTKHFK